ncbi:MAG: tRNA-modifying protein YgfZ [Pseudomonadota bacterium]|nr:tRNA-modifying protein YgfZ [Pseudomonadota bacterium]
MKPDWEIFLRNAGAIIENNSVAHYGNPELERRIAHNGLLVCDLSHRGLIAAYGNDAATFLQGQLTNDIRDVSDQHSQLSASCTPKGRMLASFRIFKRGETFYLSLPQSLLEITLKRLRMFLLMAKATLEDASQSLVGIGVSGPQIELHLQEKNLTLPLQTDDVTQTGDYTIIRLGGPQPRFEIYGELDAMKELWEHLDVHAAPVGAGVWEMLDILAGTPTIYPQTSEAFVPQMANMQIINGVNFRKGCYTGQEIVARMQYLGKLKRRMYRVHIAGEQAVHPGDPLYSSNSTSGQGTGNIVSAQPDPNGGHMALAVIDISDAENGNLHLHDAGGAAITLLDLPYPVEIKNNTQAS